MYQLILSNFGQNESITDILCSQVFIFGGIASFLGLDVVDAHQEFCGTHSLCMKAHTYESLSLAYYSFQQMADIDLEDEAEKVTLVSLEQEKYSVPRRVAMMSELVKTILEGDASATDIPLPHVKGSVLGKVVTYMKYHVDNIPKEIERPLKSPVMSDVVEQWDADFIDVSQEELFDIILAASYLHIKCLLDLGCAKVASLIKNKTPEQIRKILNIVSDFSPEELEALRQESKWAEER